MTMDRIAIASIRTAMFRFAAIGNSPEQATALARAAWRTHAEATGADPEYLGNAPAAIEVVDGAIGAVFRDGAPFRILPEGHGDHPAEAHSTKTEIGGPHPHDGDGNMLCRYCTWPVFYCSETDWY